MTTPAHAILNLLVLPREDRGGRPLWLPIALGAIAPDATMFGFYAYQKLIAGTPESTIWNDLYFRPEWQVVFDIPHSWPLMALGLWMAWRMASAPWLCFFASMMLHGLGDFLLHNDDAHRHFYPLSDYLFMSPVSYWDPQHYGQIVAPLEALLVVVGSIVLYRASESRSARSLLGVLGGLYLLGMAYAIGVWVGT